MSQNKSSQKPNRSRSNSKTNIKKHSRKTNISNKRGGKRVVKRGGRSVSTDLKKENGQIARQPYNFNKVYHPLAIQAKKDKIRNSREPTPVITTDLSEYIDDKHAF